MKRLIILLLIAICALASCGSGEPSAGDYDLTTKDGIQEYTETSLAEDASVTVDKITVNDHAGDGHSGEYILLVDLTYKYENSKADLTKNSCQATSDKFVTTLQDAAPDITMCAFFFDTNRGDMKVQYERDESGKFYISDLTAAF